MITIDNFIPNRELRDRMILSEISEKKEIAILLEGDALYRKVHVYIAYTTDDVGITFGRLDGLTLTCYQTENRNTETPDMGYREFSMASIVDVIFLNDPFDIHNDFNPFETKYEGRIVSACDPLWFKANIEDEFDDVELFVESDDDTDRRISRLIKAEGYLSSVVWYNRCHLPMKYEIATGKIEIATAEEARQRGLKQNEYVDKTVWEKAVKAGLRIEAELGAENIVIEDDFEWGMINGKLSAIRWVLGDDWDELGC